MVKVSIVESIFQKVGIPKKEASQIVEVVLKTIKEAMEKGEGVKISGFGSFLVRQKKARKVRNPKTGKEIEIASRRTLAFRPSTILKKALHK